VRPCFAWGSWGRDAGGSLLAIARNHMSASSSAPSNITPAIAADQRPANRYFASVSTIALAIIALVIAGLSWRRRHRAMRV